MSEKRAVPNVCLADFFAVLKVLNTKPLPSLDFHVNGYTCIAYIIGVQIIMIYFYNLSSFFSLSSLSHYFPPSIVRFWSSTITIYNFKTNNFIFRNLLSCSCLIGIKIKLQAECINYFHPQTLKFVTYAINLLIRLPIVWHWYDWKTLLFNVYFKTKKYKASKYDCKKDEIIKLEQLCGAFSFQRFDKSRYE